MPATQSIFITIDGQKSETVSISPSFTIEEVRSVFKAAANIPEGSKGAKSVCTSVMKLYNNRQSLIPIGPHIPPNTADSPYNLVVKTGTPFQAKQPENINKVVASLKATKAVLEEVPDLKKKVANIKKNFDLQPATISTQKSNDPTSKPAMRRINKIALAEIEESVKNERPKFSKEVLEHLKHPTFDIWQWKDFELIGLMENMFLEFGLISTFSMDPVKLHKFLQCVKHTYNRNPFHNFQHCFCVTQMMYGILHMTGVHTRLSAIEKLCLLVSAIGHDLDHPGMNNAYQINAHTDFAIVYNDISPLENHHAAVLFAILKDPKYNILAGLSDTQYKDLRKNAISCILATDMAKHGEILGKFKAHADNFNFEDPAQRNLLCQILMKCSDISNEVRPKHVSEPWVDNLLEEFFGQSDLEKKEGLPTAPFMDREKVTKSSAQVGFIEFVMIPLYETVAKVLPNMEETIIQPIRKAHEYYKSMLEKK